MQYVIRFGVSRQSFFTVHLCLIWVVNLLAWTFPYFELKSDLREVTETSARIYNRGPLVH